jgi:Dyp-type peroxidase family
MANKIDAAEAAEFLPPPPSDPVLPLDDIQGDILVGLTKTAEVFVFFEIVKVAAFKTALRSVARHNVTSVRNVRDDDARIKRAKEVAASSKKGPGLLKIRHLNIAFSANGLEKLKAGSLPALPQEFRDGAASRASQLHDPVDNDGKPSSWDPEFDEARQDGVLIATGESLAAANDSMHAVLQKFGASLTEVHRHIGHVRPGEHRGKEHFGFEDGISQPGIRGLTARENPHDDDQGVPGQDLLWPGEFVFGWPAQIDHGDKITPPGSVRQPPIGWMANGSFLVFRKLEQQVPEFTAFVESSAVTLGLDPEVLGARLVGRWKSGAPLIKAPLQDDELLAADRLRNNNFEFGGDPHQRRCPYAAHIRKAYPRDDMGDAGEVDVQRHRLRRAGIPYGQEVDDDPTGTRGLTFVAYMTSIEHQFEFVQSSWSNNPGFLPDKKRPGGGPPEDVVPGIDAIIGQPGTGEQIKVDEPVPNYPGGSQRSSLILPHSFVTPRFAGYYFSPSLSALKGALSD